MIRVLNFASFALTAFVCLALYHISEQTRIVRAQLSQTERQISDQHDVIKVLEADWERVSSPTRIQALAATRLGLEDSANVALASLELLPARGEQAPSLVTAAIKGPEPRPVDPVMHLIVARPGD